MAKPVDAAKRVLEEGNSHALKKIYDYASQNPGVGILIIVVVLGLGGFMAYFCCKRGGGGDDRRPRSRREETPIGEVRKTKTEIDEELGEMEMNKNSSEESLLKKDNPEVEEAAYSKMQNKNSQVILRGELDIDVQMKETESNHSQHRENRNSSFYREKLMNSRKESKINQSFDNSQQDFDHSLAMSIPNLEADFFKPLPEKFDENGNKIEENEATTYSEEEMTTVLKQIRKKLYSLARKMVKRSNEISETEGEMTTDEAVSRLIATSKR